MHVVSLLCSDMKLPGDDVSEGRETICGLGLPTESPGLTRVETAQFTELPGATRIPARSLPLIRHFHFD